MDRYRLTDVFLIGAPLVAMLVLFYKFGQVFAPDLMQIGIVAVGAAGLTVLMFFLRNSKLAIAVTLWCILLQVIWIFGGLDVFDMSMLFGKNGLAAMFVVSFFWLALLAYRLSIDESSES